MVTFKNVLVARTLVQPHRKDVVLPTGKQTKIGLQAGSLTHRHSYIRDGGPLRVRVATKKKSRNARTPAWQACWLIFQIIFNLLFFIGHEKAGARKAPDSEKFRVVQVVNKFTLVLSKNQGDGSIITENVFSSLKRGARTNNKCGQ